MSNSYHKNLVFTAACIGMCFFGVSMITLGAVLPSLIAKLNLSGLQTTSLVTFLPLGMLAGSLIFGPIVDRFGHKALLVPSCIIVLLGMEGLAFFESVPLLQASIVGIGLGGGILNGETNALVSDISGESEKGSRLSFLGMFYGLGALGIPMLLGSLSRHYSFETILLGIGVVMLAGIIFCIPVRFPAPKQAQGFRFYLLEYRNLHHTCYGQSRYHAGQCNQCLIGRNIRHLPKVTRGPVVADTLDAALEKKNEAE